MAEFLHDQGQTGIQEQMKVRADAQTDFGNQEEHGDAHEIACTGHLFFIQDVSTNGTFIDGKRLKRNYVYPIQAGQKITLAGNTCGMMFGLMPMEGET